MYYLTNSFSINMFKDDHNLVSFVKIGPADALMFLTTEHDGFISAIGHEDTARLVGRQLGIDASASRVSVKIGEHDHMIVAQYSGPRLPEGATELPEGAKIDFWYVYINEPE